MSTKTRTGVCAWCGTTFVAPSRGRVPTYCKTSHRIRAYEQRRMAAALAQAGQREPGPEAVDPKGRPAEGKSVRVTIAAASTGIAELRAAAARATSAAPTRPNELRQSIAEVAAGMRGVLADAGLPEIDPEDAAWWSLVVPVSQALRRAEAMAAAAPRSSRSLQSALETLLSVAGALTDPEATARQQFSYAHLAVAVPGPAGFAAGTFHTDTVGRYKVVHWAPDGDSYSTRTLAQLAGRPEGFRYRWEDKLVWDQLAHDMIVVACGWQVYPDRLPPALGRKAAASLGEQLRRDLGTSEWAVHAHDIVKWLARIGLVTPITPLPEPTSAQDECVGEERIS